MTVGHCPVAPLTHDGPMLDAYIELGELDLPVMIMPMPATGTTGPASLFGTVCLATAARPPPPPAQIAPPPARPGRSPGPDPAPSRTVGT